MGYVIQNMAASNRNTAALSLTNLSLVDVCEISSIVMWLTINCCEVVSEICSAQIADKSQEIAPSRDVRT
jgi:hypothetical protein